MRNVYSSCFFFMRHSHLHLKTYICVRWFCIHHSFVRNLCLSKYCICGITVCLLKIKYFVLDYILNRAICRCVFFGKFSKYRYSNDLLIRVWRHKTLCGKLEYLRRRLEMVHTVCVRPHKKKFSLSYPSASEFPAASNFFSFLIC